MPDNQPSNASFSKSRLDQDDSPQPIDSQLTTDEGQPITAPHARAASPTLPLSLGRYELREEIARGGMGAVFRAEDKTFQRTLAIKALLPDFERSDVVKGRFLDEARLMGWLQHPGIPPVHDQGELPDGRPFFCMKLIEGHTLAEMLRRRTDLSDDLPRMIDVFEQICQTLAYAHSRGIIHRDLKPNNVMVGAFGEVQVMDWGLAKVLAVSATPETKKAEGVLKSTSSQVSTIDPRRSSETPHQTAAGSFLGTPAYAAPEQARGEIANLDECCDVFGVGAILCQILTGKPPFAAGSNAENLKLAMQGDLSDAYARLEACGADAAMIALAKRCLAPQPRERFADAGEVARAVADYQECLQQRLKQAEIERAEARTKAVEERKRRRVWLGLAAAVLLLVVSAAAVALWYVNDRAQLAAQRKIDNERKQADNKKRLDLMLASIDNGLTFMGQLRFNDAGREIHKTKAQLLADDPFGVRTKVEEVHEDWRIAYKLDGIQRDKAIQVEGKSLNVEASDKRFADVLRASGMGEVEQDDAADVAARMRRSRVKDYWIGALDDWAAITPNAERRRWLLAVLRELDAQAKHLRDPDLYEDPSALKRLLDQSNVSGLSPQLLNGLAMRLGRQNNEALLRRACERYPSDFWLNSQLGKTLLFNNKLDEAVGYFRVALVLRPDSGLSHNNLGYAYELKGEYDKAFKHFRDALELEPKNPFVHHNLGIAYATKGNHGEKVLGSRKPRIPPDRESLRLAIEQFQTVLELAPAIYQARQNLGLAYAALGDLDKAIEQFNLALAADSRYFEARVALAAAYDAANKPTKAIEHYELAIQIDPKNTEARTNLGLVYKKAGEEAKAIEQWKTSLEINPRDAYAHFNLGKARTKKDPNKAIEHYLEAIRIDSKFAQPHNNLGNIYADRGQADKAVEHFHAAIKIDPQYAKAHFNLGTVYGDRRDWKTAIKHYEQALTFDRDYRNAHTNLANALFSIGETRRAIEHYLEAIRIDPNDFYSHAGLGNAYSVVPEIDLTVKHYRRALDVAPENARPRLHAGFGYVLLQLGMPAAARKETEQCLRVLPRNDPERQRVERQLQQSEHFLALDTKLERKDYAPEAAREMLDLAWLCQRPQRRQYHRAAQFYQKAFEKDAKLAADLSRQHRYNGACALVLAAAGQGNDASDLMKDARAELRAQALKWLQADLADYEKTAAASSRSHKAIEGRLTHWRNDADLASVRDAESLEKVPESERKQWREMWDAHKKLLSKVRPK